MKVLQLLEIAYRALLVLFIDLVLSKRITWIYDLKDAFISPLLEFGNVPFSKDFSNDFTTLVIAIGKFDVAHFDVFL